MRTVNAADRKPYWTLAEDISRKRQAVLTDMDGLRRKPA